MQAAVFKGKGIIEVEQRRTPVPKENEVLVRVRACGICGTDVHIFEGAEGAGKTEPPIILGHEFAGVIEQVGSAVKELKPGDRVSVDPNNMCGSCYYCKGGMAHFCENMIGYGTTTDGAFAEYCVVDQKQVYRLEDHVDFIHGCMAEPVACCLHGIDLCDIRMGTNVMVIGGGTIGLLMVQLAKMAGAAKVVLLEPIAEKRAQGKTVGADVTIDPIGEDVPAVLAQHGIDRFETVIECVGLKQTMQDAIRYAGKNSVVMLFGLGHPDDVIPVKPFELFKKEITVKASFINPYTQDRAIALIASGRLDIDTLIDRTIGLEELAQTLADSSKRSKGKVIVTV